VKKQTKVIGRFTRESSCMSLCWAVLDFIPWLETARYREA